MIRINSSREVDAVEMVVVVVVVVVVLQCGSVQEKQNEKEATNWAKKGLDRKRKVRLFSAKN